MKVVIDEAFRATYAEWNEVTPKDEVSEDDIPVPTVFPMDTICVFLSYSVCLLIGYPNIYRMT